MKVIATYIVEVVAYNGPDRYKTYIEVLRTFDNKLFKKDSRGFISEYTGPDPS